MKKILDIVHWLVYSTPCPQSSMAFLQGGQDEETFAEGIAKDDTSSSKHSFVWQLGESVAAFQYGNKFSTHLAVLENHTEPQTSDWNWENKEKHLFS